MQLWLSINLVVLQEIVMSAERLIMSSPPENLGSTDAEGLNSVVQTILRTTEIAAIEVSFCS